MTLQTLLAVSERWYLFAAAGAQKDLRARLSGKGLAEGLRADFESPLGWTGELGAYFAETWHLAVGLGLRYTVARYEIEGRSINASNIAFNLTMHVNP
jgi:hypothetical protein